MKPEDLVLLEERTLVVEGHLSAKTRKAIRMGMRKELAPTSRVCFVSYSYADAPLPKDFDTVFRGTQAERAAANGDAGEARFQPRNLADALFTHVSIVEAMDTNYQSLKALPDGRSTICVIEFPRGVPFIIDDLPTVRDWGESKDGVVLCSRETLQAIKEASKQRR